MGLTNSTMTESQLLALWDTFLQRWPAQKLSQMTLEQYTKVGEKDTFTYWLESETEDLGSVWGGSSFKFGIFHRKDRKKGENQRGRTYTLDYAWYTKYGKSASAAFEVVRRHICTIAEEARAGKLEAVDAVDLGTSIKWKVAFLYQKRSDPKILPVFKSSHIRAFLGKDTPSRPMAQLQAQVMGLQRDSHLFEFGSRVWSEAEARLSEGALTPRQALEYLSERFDQPEDPTKKIAGFVTDSGEELALEVERKVPALYLRPGNWLRSDVRVLQEYAPQDSRHGDLSAQAPKLAQGNPACHLEVRTIAALRSLCDDYEKPDTGFDTADPRSTMSALSGAPLNQILFGPPGTGKTFHTVTEALRILDPAYLRQHADDRAMLKQRFDELRKEERVRMVTFHQSFSYEDFVEGIRADTDEGNPGIVKYPVAAGVFREICEAAQVEGTVPNSSVRANAKVWKLSIGRRSDERIRQACFRRGEARIGWGYVGDLSSEERSKEQVEAFDEEGSNNKHSLRVFSEEVAKGDIFLCLRSRSSVEAVGVVESDYEFDSEDEKLWNDYFHVRKVRWLATDLDVDIRSLNGGEQLTQKTIYELKRINVADALGLAGRLQTGPQRAVPYVLIIDEINRANISKVFGELITLLEPSKRAGAAEALEVTLPYSQKAFSVPANLYVIGTMNTADRSLATLDIALRRRFEFVEMAPDPTTLAGISIAGVNVGALLEVMNQRIEVLLDRDHALGHAYFLPLQDRRDLADLAHVFRKQILPLLQEYFFEDWERIGWVLNDHRKPIEAHRFIVKPGYRIASLLGEGPGIPTETRQWRINNHAFEHPESFRGIVDAG
jgi:5-methylcytosine-specific restriction enzyme B